MQTDFEQNQACPWVAAKTMQMEYMPEPQKTVPVVFVWHAADKKIAKL